MKRIKGWAALLLAVLVMTGVLLTGCGNGTSQSTEPTPLMLWEVTDDDNNKLYLMGSIHIGDESMIPLAEPIEDAFMKSDALAVECDIVAFNEDTELQTDIAMKYGVYLDGTTVKDYIDTDIYNEAKKVLQKYDMYADAYDYMRVHQWSSLLQSLAIEKSGFDSDYGVDMYLLNQAKQIGKPIYEVESVEAQMQMMDNFSIELQEWMLEMNLDVDLLATQLKMTVEQWKSGDVELLSETESDDGEELTAEQEKLLAEYNKEMITDRNTLMADKAETYLESGEVVFFTVGAGHMGGETGVVAQMKKKGYTVKRIDENGSYVQESAVAESSMAA